MKMTLTHPNPPGSGDYSQAVVDFTGDMCIALRNAHDILWAHCLAIKAQMIAMECDNIPNPCGEEE